jgi:hypothetical protein
LLVPMHAQIIFAKGRGISAMGQTLPRDLTRGAAAIPP